MNTYSRDLLLIYHENWIDLVPMQRKSQLRKNMYKAVLTNIIQLIMELQGCTLPSPRCRPEHCRQIQIPYVTETHWGLSASQSQHALFPFSAFNSFSTRLVRGEAILTDKRSWFYTLTSDSNSNNFDWFLSFLFFFSVVFAVIKRLDSVFVVFMCCSNLKQVFLQWKFWLGRKVVKRRFQQKYINGGFCLTLVGILDGSFDVFSLVCM